MRSSSDAFVAEPQPATDASPTAVPHDYSA
jgi:hypothetical protein